MMHQILALVRATIVDPRQTAHVILRHVPERGHLIEAMVLVMILSVFVTWASVVLGPDLGDDAISNLIRMPIMLGVVQLMLGFLSAIFIFVIGRMFGGKGSFDETLLISVWLNFVIILIEFVELPLYLLGQSLVGAVSLLTAGFAVWLSVNFIAVLHGFRSLFKVFAGMLGATFTLMFLLLLLIGMAGISA